jgi:hypothetical protein
MPLKFVKFFCPIFFRVYHKMEDIVILILLALLVFFIWNGRQPATYQSAEIQQAPDVEAPIDKPIPPEVTQGILDQIRTGEIPIDTLFVKELGDGKYSARFLFFNPQGYTGAQYDVTAQTSDGVLTVTGKTQVADAPDEWNPSYKGSEYTEWTALGA